MQLSEQVAFFIHTQRLGVYDPKGLTGNVFLQSMPAAPAEAIGVFTTGGPSPDRRGEYGLAAVQVLIRTIPGDPRKGEVTANALVDALNGFSGGPLAAGGDYIFDTEAIQGAANNIGQDEDRRYEFSQNFIIEYIK